MAKKSQQRNYDSSKTIQRVVRIDIAVDAWLNKRVATARMKNPISRDGIATEINKILNDAYQATQQKSA